MAEDLRNENHRAGVFTLAFVAAVLGFVVALEVADGSSHRELWLVGAVCLWAMAAILGVLYVPRRLLRVYRRLFRRP